MVFAVAGERWSEEEFAEGDKDIFIVRQLLLARRFRTKQPLPLCLRRTRVVPEQGGGDSGDRGYPNVGSGVQLLCIKETIFEDLRIFVTKSSADKDATRILNKVSSRTHMKN